MCYVVNNSEGICDSIKEILSTHIETSSEWMPTLVYDYWTDWTVFPSMFFYSIAPLYLWLVPLFVPVLYKPSKKPNHKVRTHKGNKPLNTEKTNWYHISCFVTYRSFIYVLAMMAFYFFLFFLQTSAFVRLWCFCYTAHRTIRFGTNVP